MLSPILNLFGRSPFAPLQSHMEKVSQCVLLLPDLFDALDKQQYEQMEEIAERISEFEHQADLTKNDIRNHLPRSLFLPVDRTHLLDILTLQDRIADAAEDVAVLTTLKHLTILPEFQTEFYEFLKKNISAFQRAQLIIQEIHELVEFSFGGMEAQKVRTMVDDVAYQEHEADLIQRRLLKKLFQSEELMTFSSFDLWQKIFHAVSSLSNLSENLAYRVRMTLELK